MALRPMRRSRGLLHHRIVPAAVALMVLVIVVVSFLLLPAAGADGAAFVPAVGGWAMSYATRASPDPTTD